MKQIVFTFPKFPIFFKLMPCLVLWTGTKAFATVPPVAPNVSFTYDCGNHTTTATVNDINAVVCMATFQFDDDAVAGYGNKHVYSQAGSHSVQIFYGICHFSTVTINFDVVVPIDLTIKTTITPANCNSFGGKIIVTSPTGIDILYLIDRGIPTNSNMFSARAGSYTLSVFQTFSNSTTICSASSMVNVPLTPITIITVNDPDVITCNASLDGQDVIPFPCGGVDLTTCTQTCHKAKYKFVAPTPTIILDPDEPTCLAALDGTFDESKTVCGPINLELCTQTCHKTKFKFDKSLIKITNITKTVTTCDVSLDGKTINTVCGVVNNDCNQICTTTKYKFDPSLIKKPVINLIEETCDATLDGTIDDDGTFCDPVNTTTCSQTCTVTNYKYVGTPAYITEMNSCLVGSYGVTWQWYLNGVKLSGATTQSIFPTTYGDYTVVIKNSKGCFSTSDPYRSNADYANSCPQIHKSFGAKCDDGNPLTVNDIVRNDCQCRGDYYSPNMTAKCPTDIVVVSTSIYGTVVNWDYSFTTNCNKPDITVKQISGYYSGYPFPVNDVSPIEYVATDMCGNKTSCRFLVRTTPLLKTATDQALVVKPFTQPSDKISFQVNGLSPNPVTDLLNLTVMSEQDNAVSFQIINSLGAVLMTENKVLNYGENIIKLDVSQLPAGLYLVLPQTAEGKVVPTKFVKL